MALFEDVGHIIPKSFDVAKTDAPSVIFSHQ